MAMLHERADPGAIRVLIADANVDAAVMFSCLVQLLGCVAAVAYDGATAIKVSAQFGPDVSFVSMEMPDMSGT